MQRDAEENLVFSIDFTLNGEAGSAVGRITWVRRSRSSFPPPQKLAACGFEFTSPPHLAYLCLADYQRLERHYPQLLRYGRMNMRCMLYSINGLLCSA
jgi:hypothetical protein